MVRTDDAHKLEHSKRGAVTFREQKHKIAQVRDRLISRIITIQMGLLVRNSISEPQQPTSVAVNSQVNLHAASPLLRSRGHLPKPVSFIPVTEYPHAHLQVTIS